MRGELDYLRPTWVRANGPASVAIYVLAAVAAVIPTGLCAGFQTNPRGGAGPLSPEGAERSDLALVLSGGGAWGLIHAGVIQAMEEIGIRPDLIVGTSMGAIIGSLLAAGYTGAEIEDLVLELPLHRVFCGYSPRMPPPLDRLPVFLTLEQVSGEPWVLDLPLAKSSWAEGMIREALSARSSSATMDFSSLEIRFYAIATDLGDPEPVVLSEGDVTTAVMASSAIPLVLEPVEVQGAQLVDGGLRENIPVETARSLGARRVIVSDATAGVDLDGRNISSDVTMIGVITENLFRQEDPDLGPEDVLIRPDLGDYPKLGFSRKEKEALIRIGREAGLELLQGLGPRRPETDDQSDPPGNGHEDLNPWIPDRMVLTPETLPPGSRSLGFGVGYDYDLGPSARVGVVDTRLGGEAIVWAGVLSLGELENNLDLSLRGGSNLFAGAVPLLAAKGGHHRIRQFDLQGEALTTRDISSFGGFLGPEHRSKTGWTVRGGVRLDAWKDPEEAGARSSVGAEVWMDQENRNGTRFHFEGTLSGDYARASLSAHWTARMGSAVITPAIRAGLGRDLPYLFTFPLGGSAGFPGLHNGEGRGQREAVFSLGAARDLMGPLRMLLEVASGIGGEDGTSVSPDHVLLGARICLGMDTKVGPVDLGYGRSSNGRGAFYLRIGQIY